MLDIMLTREFGVEEINAQGVAKAFIEGCRMMSLLNDHNIMADIDDLSLQRPIQRPSGLTNTNISTYIKEPPQSTQNELPIPIDYETEPTLTNKQAEQKNSKISEELQADLPVKKISNQDAIANLFGISTKTTTESAINEKTKNTSQTIKPLELRKSQMLTVPIIPDLNHIAQSIGSDEIKTSLYQIHVSGVGINTSMSIIDEEDIAIAIALLEKIRKQLKN